MGGSCYDGDVGARTSASGDYFTSSKRAKTKVHDDLHPKSRTLSCSNETPIVVAMDVTRSRGDDSKVVYAKLPMFIGQIVLQGYVEDPSMSFTAIGDADSDKAPLQVGDFASDNTLDDILAKMWLEEGGGGTGQESYELAAYYYAKHVSLDCNNKDRKGYFFFVGDEGFYPKIAVEHVRDLIGDELEAPLDSAAIFEELQEKFHVFFIYPQKSWESRKQDIDAEIRSRVLAAGGQVDNVDIRASLLWNNYNDLDLHVICPSGEKIYYGHKKSACHGWLDVDANAGNLTKKPVENIRWGKGDAQKGHYKVFVRNYSLKGDKIFPTPFQVEIEIDGDVHSFSGEISPEGETGSNSDIVVYEFDYDPDQNYQREEYDAYSDETIKNQWSSVIPPENLLLIEKPKAIVDAMLGVLSIVEGTRTLDGYLSDMLDRGQTDERREQTTRSLSKLATLHASTAEVSQGLPPKSGNSVQSDDTTTLD
jgi:uncharacterized protein YfaP (DUF2135 family)